MTVRTAWFMVSMLLAGCSWPLSAPPAPATHTLTLATLEIPPQTLPESGSATPVHTVQIIETSAAPGYTTAAMVYRKAPHELRSFAHHRWVEPPARLLAQALHDGLSGTGIAVVRGGTGARPDLRLLSELLVLEQDFTHTPSQLRLALRMQLVDVREGRLLASRTVQLQRAAPSDNPDGGVAAANALLPEVVAAAQAFIRQHAGGAGRTPPVTQIPAR